MLTKKCIYAFGDSHSILYVFFEPISKYTIHEDWLGFSNLPVNMYRFGREGLDILQAPKILGNGHENFIPELGDVIIYCYGYNDIQKNIWEHGSDQLSIIDSLVEEYKNKLLLNKNKYHTIVQAVYLPPWSSTWHGTESLGTTEKKYDCTLYMNRKLKEMCDENGFHFFDGFFNLTADHQNKHIKREYAGDGGHISNSLASQFLPIFEEFIDNLNLENIIL